MTKSLYLALVMIASVQLNAQNLEEKIPATAESVFKIDGVKLTKKIGKRKIEKSAAFLKFTSELFFHGNQDISMSDVGIDIAHDLILFFNADTSVEYVGYLYGIENAKYFGKYLKENTSDATIEEFEDFNVLFYEDNYHLLAWNNEYALFASIEYLHEDLKPLEREYDWLGDSFGNGPDYVETIDVYGTEVEEAVCEDGEVIEQPEVVISQEEAAEIEAQKKAAEEAFKLKQTQRIQRLRQTYKTLLNPFFASKRSENILNNDNYVKGKNPDADLYLWISQNNNLSNYSYYDYNYYYQSRRHYRKFMRGFNQYFGDQMYFNGLFEKNKIAITSDIEYDAEISKYFNEIYSTKISEKLLPYINADKALAISSLSLKAEKIWKYYPRMYARIYEKMFSRNADYSDEIAVFVDFVEIFMDEKALGEIVTGDGVLILKDLAEIEVKYTTYEYNEDYSERTEVEKTKTEIYPQFIGMFTTENQVFLEKLLGLAVKNEIMYRGNQYYYSNGENRDLPFELGFTIQNGVAMVSTNLEEIKAFAAGKTDSSIPKEFQSNMYNNQGYLFANIQEILKRIPTRGLKDVELEALEYVQNNTRTVEGFSNLKDGLLHSTFDINIPSNAKNGAAYAWELINDLYDITER